MIEENIGPIAQHSSAFKTEPWRMKEEPWFINQVVRVNSNLSPEEILEQLLSIEREFGRKRTDESAHYTSRTLDIDILYYDDLVVDTEALIIPHPRLHLRRFALEPLAEISPTYRHPILNKTQQELLSECTDTGEIQRI